MRSLLFLLMTVALASIGDAGVHTSTVRYPSGKDTVSSFLALPGDTGAHPAIVMVHEWWGLNDWIKGNAERLAAKGYVVLAVDLYRGAVAKDAEAAHELMRGLPEDRAARDLMAAAAFLRQRPDVKKSAIGSLGWCMGGGYSLETALHVPDLAGCVICYGRLVTDSARVGTIPCPVLGIFGEDDLGIPPKDVNEFASLVKGMGKTIDVKIYPKSGHAFMNPNNGRGFNEAAAKDAWERIEAFFSRVLH